MSLRGAVGILELTLRQTGLKAAGAESCTGGLAAASITAIAGASEYFLGSAVVYSNEAKSRLLGVSTETIAKYGAVSSQTVEAMAIGAIDAFGADLAFAISGIAGPDGGSADKPVGTVWFGFASSAGVSSETRRFKGNRTRVRLAAAEFALARVSAIAASVGHIDRA